ncbi:hypothetical protein PLESTM_000883700 [Pleodorina starrii]|nr:hypothetical protein PLESTM_000883700 [Pleodorina starrii]
MTLAGMGHDAGHTLCKVKLDGVKPNVDVDRLTRKVIRSFPRRLDPNSVKYDQVRRLVVSLVDFLNGSGTNGTDGVASAAAGAAPGRNGTTPHVPSRLGPGGGAGARAPGRLSNLPANGSHEGGANGLNGSSVASPMPSASPRGADPRIGPAARVAMAGRTANYRGSVESTMSRFSTSTASASGSGSSSGEVTEEEEAGTDGGGGMGRSASESGLASALDELEKEMAAGPGSTSDLSMTMPTNGVVSAGASSSSLDTDSRGSSFSVRDRPLPPLPAKLPPVGAAAAGAGPGAAAGAAAGAGAASKTRFAAEAEKLVIGLEVTDDLDLNKVTEVELKMAKQAMEADFMKNQLRPGDPGYVYDKQEDFGPPTEVNDWDDSGDEEEEPSEEPEVDWADIHATVSKPKGAVTSVQVRAGMSSGSDNGSKNGQSPYNSNDWP